MTERLFICPTCGWLYLEVVESGKVAVCGKPYCRCRLLRVATAEERAALPIGATVGPPKQDVLLKDSRRFYIVEKGGGFEVYDNHIDDRDPKSLIMADVAAEEVENLTEGYLRTVTPAREVEVAVRIPCKFSLVEEMANRHGTDRDSGSLLMAVHHTGVRGGMATVTVPASWCAGDSELHEAGWYIERRGDVEEVCKVAPRIRGDGVVYVPKPKEVLRFGSDSALRRTAAADLVAQNIVVAFRSRLGPEFGVFVGMPIVSASGDAVRPAVVVDRNWSPGQTSASDPVAVFDDDIGRLKAVAEIPSVMQRFLFADDHPHVQTLTRTPKGWVWDHGLEQDEDALLEIPAVGLAIPISELYRGVPLVGGGGVR